MKSILRPLAVLATVAFSGTNALADDHATGQFYQTTTVNPFEREGSFSEKDDTETTFHFVEKNIYIVFDASSSQEQVDREAAMLAIIDTLEKPDVATFLDAGNFYRLSFISFGKGAFMEQEIVINNVDSAVEQVSAFFMGEDGHSPVSFSVDDSATRLNGAFDIIRMDMNANGQYYHETDILVITDAMLTDKVAAEEDMNDLLDAYPQIQIHCGLIDRGKNNHTQTYLETFVSPQRLVPSLYGEPPTVQAGNCAILRTETEIPDRVNMAERLKGPMSSAFSYTLG